MAFVVINANRHEGTSRAVLEVAERLADRGHRVDLWARTYERPHTKVCWHRIAGPSRPEVLDFESFRITCDRRLATSQYDIIHSAGPNTVAADVYTIQTVHPVKVRQFDLLRAASDAGPIRRFSWGIYDRKVISAERRAYHATGDRGAKAFLPVSSGTADELTTEYPSLNTNDDNITVVPNGADLEHFNPTNRDHHRSAVRAEHGLSNDDFLLVFSGGDWRRKGLDLALRAIPKIQDARVKLLVVGHDRAGEDVRRLASELGIQSRVRFAGFRKDVHRYYAAGDLFLFPTAYEAFSLATIEAAASGLPVLMPDVSGAAELIGCGTTGTIIRRDPDHIANVVRTYLQSPDRLRQHAVAARAIVESKFNWNTIADQTFGVYQRLIEQRSRSEHQSIV